MGKILEFPINIDLLKYLGSERSARVMDELTRELGLKLNLSNYGHRSYLSGAIDEPSLEGLIKPELREYKKALSVLKGQLKDGSLLVIEYSGKDGKKGYITSAEDKKYFDLSLEDGDKLPLLSARIHNFVEGEGQHMELRYAGQLVDEEVASLYAFHLKLNGIGSPVSISLSSYSFRTIVEESDYEDTYDFISDINNQLPTMSKQDDIDLLGPGLNLGLVFNLETISKMKQDPVGFSK